VPGTRRGAFQATHSLKYADLSTSVFWLLHCAKPSTLRRDYPKGNDGKCHLSLYKGNVSVVSRESEHSLYRTDLSSFTMDDSYDQKDAAGFIRILGLLPARVPARTGGRTMKMWSGRFRQPLDPEFDVGSVV